MLKSEPRRMIRSVFFVVVTSLLCVGNLEAQERTWTSSDGKFKVVAELIKLDGDKVQLKRMDNGKVITVPLDRLSKADNKFLSSAPATGEEPVEEKTNSSTQFKVSGKLKWSEFSNFDDSGKELPPDLQLLIEAKGKAAVEAFQYGFVNLDKCTSDAGEMSVKEDEFSFDDIATQFVQVVRSDNDFFADHPRDGVRVTLDFDHPANDLRNFTKVEGSFKIKTGGTRETIQIDKASSIEGDVDHKKFKSLGVAVSVSKDDNSISLELDGKHQSIIDVRLGDANGKPLKGQNGSGRGGGGDLMSYQFFFENAVPSNATFFVTVVENPEEMTIPFQLTDLKMPPKKGSR